MQWQASPIHLWEAADLKLKSLGLKDISTSSSYCDFKSSPSANMNSAEAVPFPKPSTSLLVGARGAVLLQTAIVHAYNPDKPECSIHIRAILDTGSQQSYASQRVKDALALKRSRKQTMSVMTFSSSDQVARTSDVVRLGLVTKDGRRQELELFVVPFICQPLTTQPIDLCAAKYKHLASLDLADTSSARASMDVDLLIGSDCYWNFVTGEIRRGDAGPVAINTRFGWVLSGVAPTPRKPHTSHSFLATHVLQIDASSDCPERLDEVLHSFWRLESWGINDPGDTVLEEFSQTVQFNEGRYEVTLPWKDSHPRLPDNFVMSSKRLQSLLHRLRQNPDILHEYDSVIKSQLRQGIVEKVDQPSVE